MSSIDLWYTTRATGLVALVLLSGHRVAGHPDRRAGPYHAARVCPGRGPSPVSALAVVFLAVHVLTAVLDTYVNIGWLAIVVPFTSSYHTFWLALGTIGADLLLAVAISSALRQHIPARTWRALHWLAYLSWPVAVSHALGMGTDRKLTWALGLLAVCVAGVVAAATWRVAGACGHRPPCPTRSSGPAAPSVHVPPGYPGIGGRP